MKQISLMLAFMVFSFYYTIAQSENGQRFNHQLGIQFNPFLNELFFTEFGSGKLSRSLWVLSSRYGFNTSLDPNLIWGGEITYFQSFSTRPTGYYQIQSGPWLKYNLFSRSWVKLFAETSVYIIYSKSAFDFTGTLEQLSGFDWGYYLSPGFSLNAADNPWSYDLSWKFSTKTLIDYRNNVFSFKVNYNF
jgi:hypothetical protein